MKQFKSLVICLITILVTFSSIGTAAGQTPPYHIYLPLVSTTLLENPPVAVDDTYSTNQDTQLIVTAPGVLENDSDPDGDTLTAVWVGDPVHGNLTLTGMVRSPIYRILAMTALTALPTRYLMANWRAISPRSPSPLTRSVAHLVQQPLHLFLPAMEVIQTR